jgi:asparagine synthase (glutamine-hydrolysing)
VGEPFADIGILPMYQISRAARQHITVALSGDGGDESFAGYPNVTSAFAAERIRRRVPPSVTRALEALTGLDALGHAVPPIGRAHRFLRRYVNGGVVGQFDASNYWDEASREGLYSANHAAALGESRASVLVAALTDSRPDLRWPDQNLFVDLHLRLGGGYLTKIDIASNMVSLEVRSPFLDHELVEFAASLPLERKLLGGQQKGLLREYATRILPHEIVSQPKRGFAPPIDDWLRGSWSELVSRLADHSMFVEAGILRREAVERVANAHLSGRESHGQRLWNLVCLECWGESFLS